MSFRGRTRSTWQQGHQEDTEVSELSSDNISSRSPSVETVAAVEVDDEATDQLSLKLNRLTEKLCRYESHKYFITKCLKDKLIPEGFYSLEPSIGNHDDEFLQEWYEDLNNFLLTRMEKTVQFCDKTITTTKSNINQIEEDLRKKTAPSNFKEVREEVKKNKDGYSAQLTQRKNKKFHNLKFKGNRRAGNRNNHTDFSSNHTIQPNATTNIQTRPSYSQVVQTTQPIFSKPPPLRRETNTRYFNQRQLQQTTNQGRVNFTLGRQQEVKPATFSGSQKSTPFRGQQNEPSKNAVPAPAQTGDMNAIFTNTMQQLSHAAEAITALEKFFRQNFSENRTEEEQ